MQGIPDGFQFRKYGRHIAQLNRVGTVAQSFFRIGVNLHKNAVRSGCHGRTRQYGRKFTLSARAGTLAARQLYAVRGIKNNRTAHLTHDGDASEINDEIVITEGCPPFGQ